MDKLSIKPDGFFSTFHSKTKAMTAMERAKFLEGDDSLEDAHGATANQGQSAVPDATDDVNLHFICYVEKGGALYELDGRKHAPIHHGKSSPETLLADAVAAIKRDFMDRNPNELHFTMMAFGNE